MEETAGHLGRASEKHGTATDGSGRAGRPHLGMDGRECTAHPPAFIGIPDTSTPFGIHRQR